ncbi:MAG: hypothetical protein JO095_04265 [Alphaproteobacteria bacterium]|nr:hypothetical protein [Alphaproteobacteria bacterium]
MVSPRARITGYEGDLLAWLETAQRWLRVVGDHISPNAPRALLKEESSALWDGAQRLNAALIRYVFASDSTLAQMDPELQEGADFRYAPATAAYRALMSELEPYRELQAIVEQNPDWTTAQTPTEVRAMLRQRTADAGAIREKFAAYRSEIDTLLRHLRVLVTLEQQ